VDAASVVAPSPICTLAPHAVSAIAASVEEIRVIKD
jgi:hypothetical protein